MSTPAQTAASGSTDRPYCPVEWVKKHAKPYTAPYYLTLVGVLGAITAVFAVIVVLMVLVATNFNVIGWME
jgi:hypothetical protein